MSQFTINNVLILDLLIKFSLYKIIHFIVTLSILKLYNYSRKTNYSTVSDNADTYSAESFLWVSRQEILFGKNGQTDHLSPV